MKGILEKHGFRFNKSYGQNFITDTNLLTAIVSDAKITATDNVLEIGAGAGALTAIIAERANKVLAVEIDEKLRPVLADALKENQNAEVVFGDFLKQDFSVLTEKLGDSFKVVANLPYYITTPIIFRLLQNKQKIKSLTVMVQKEVAERMVAAAGSENYSALTVMVNYHADIKITRIVRRGMFRPVPNVDSAIVHLNLETDKKQAKDFSVFEKLVSSAFAMRRKTLVNNLGAGFGFVKEKSAGLLAEIGKNEKIRGEELSLNDFINLSDLISK